MKRLELTLTTLSVVAAAVSTFFAFQANQEVKKVATAATYLELRHSFYDVRGRLPKHYRDDKYVPAQDSDEWNDIKAYWYQTFDEWFVTQKLNTEAFSGLWSDYYADAINAGLQRRALRAVFCDMRQRTPPAGSRSEFNAAVESLWNDRNPGIVLCATSAVSAASEAATTSK